MRGFVVCLQIKQVKDSQDRKMRYGVSSNVTWNDLGNFSSSSGEDDEEIHLSEAEYVAEIRVC